MRNPIEEGIFDALQHRASEALIPLHVSLELTLRCNIRCTHCYNFDRDAPRAPGGPELSMEEILPLLDDLRRSGTLFVSLTGGEAMVHPRFWDILEAAAKRSFAVSVLTNGTLLTPEACDRLSGCAALWNVGISLYGARPATHDGITRSPGSFERTVAGAERLHRLGTRVTLKVIVMKANAAEAGDMLSLADSLGVPASVDTTITGRYDGTPGSLSTRVGPEELDALYRGPLRHLLEEESGPGGLTCNCARQNAAVSSTGEVWPCIAAPLPAGNVRERPFGEIWKNAPVFRKIRGLEDADFEECAPCDLRRWCRRSPGSPLLLGKGYTGVDPWNCREAEIIRDVVTR